MREIRPDLVHLRCLCRNPSSGGAFVVYRKRRGPRRPKELRVGNVWLDAGQIGPEFDLAPIQHAKQRKTPLALFLFQPPSEEGTALIGPSYSYPFLHAPWPFPRTKSPSLLAPLQVRHPLYRCGRRSLICALTGLGRGLAESLVAQG